MGLFVYYESILIHWVGRGTGTPEDRDEVNRREVCECEIRGNQTEGEKGSTDFREFL